MKKYIVTLLIYLLSFSATDNLFGQEHASGPLKEHESLPPLTNPSSNPSSPNIDSPLHEFPNDLDSFFTREDKGNDDFRGKFANMLAILGLLIAFMLLASWAIKRMMKNRVTQLNTTGCIKVVETRYLSPKSCIYLLDIMGQGILIAESSAGVHQLAKINLDQLQAEENKN